jgi:hypothetical protein
MLRQNMGEKRSEMTLCKWQARGRSRERTSGTGSELRLHGLGDRMVGRDYVWHKQRKGHWDKRISDSGKRPL